MMNWPRKLHGELSIRARAVAMACPPGEVTAPRLAEAAGTTLKTAQVILGDLARAGVLDRARRGVYVMAAKGAPHTKGFDWGWSATKPHGKRLPGYREKAGIRRPVPLYALRHTCASLLLLGAPLYTGGRRWDDSEIASHLGHADLSTVRNYAVSLGIASKLAVEESRVALKGRAK